MGQDFSSGGKTASVGGAARGDGAEGWTSLLGHRAQQEERVAGRKEPRRRPGSRTRGPWVLEAELGAGLWSLFVLLNASVRRGCCS